MKHAGFRVFFSSHCSAKKNPNQEKKTMDADFVYICSQLLAWAVFYGYVINNRHRSTLSSTVFAFLLFHTPMVCSPFFFASDEKKISTLSVFAVWTVLQAVVVVAVYSRKGAKGAHLGEGGDPYVRTLTDSADEPPPMNYTQAILPESVSPSSPRNVVKKTQRPYDGLGMDTARI